MLVETARKQKGAQRDFLKCTVLLWQFFYSCKSITRLCILQQDSDNANSSCLVAIQPHGSQPPLFCLPGAGGTPFYLSNLARCLGSDQPFYSFQANNLSGELEAIAQVEDIAANYIQELLIVQPQGPYFLAGHSFGGKVAFEMAQQLIEKALFHVMETCKD